MATNISRVLIDRLTEDYVKRVSNMDLAGIRFDDSAEILGLLREVFLKGQAVDKYLMVEDAQNIDNRLVELETVLTKLDTLTANQNPNFSNDCEQIKRNIRDLYKFFSSSISPYAGLATAIPNIAEAEKANKRILEILRGAENLYSEGRTEVRGQASNLASGYFEGLANEYLPKAEQAEKRLFWALGGLGLAGLGLALSKLVNFSTFQEFHDSLPFLNLIVIGWFIVNHFSKTHKVYENLRIVNHTKATILEAGSKFALSTNDESAKDQVVTTVVGNTFVIEETGILSKRDDSSSKNLLMQLIGKVLPARNTSV